MTPSHTDARGRAKCLAYRNRKRCGRRAIALMAKVSQFHAKIVCQECADRQTAEGARTLETSKTGFSVRTSLFGPATRDYVAVEGEC